MAVIEHVTEVDDELKIKTVFVSCTNKDGLVSNKRSDGTLIKGLPEDGLLGALKKANPSLKIISTGGTYKIIKDAGMDAIEISEYTGFPEMKTGLVKSLHPKIHAGILAHKYTKSDDEFLKEHGIEYIDALIVNFYALDDMMKNPDATFEMLRQSIDVGGPSMAHNARKAFISTALITDPDNYGEIIDEKKGTISLKTRLELAKKASKMITEYLLSVDKLIQNTKIEDLDYELR